MANDLRRAPILNADSFLFRPTFAALAQPQYPSCRSIPDPADNVSGGVSCGPQVRISLTGAPIAYGRHPIVEDDESDGWPVGIAATQAWRCRAKVVVPDA
jgi:hypothetical protein